MTSDSRHFFGTDGMRGVAGEPPLDPATLYRLGHALVAYLSARGAGRRPRVAIGQDTRESCAWIGHALSRGVRDAGGGAVSAGVLPTPALALVTRAGDFGAGLMISASHNPFADNGVKVFDARGAKLPDADEAELERRMAAAPAPPADDGGDALDAHDALQEAYLHFLEECLGGTRLTGLKVVLDTAHGAAYRLAPEAFRRAGAEVITIGDAPDGRNINLDHGSMHPELMARLVVEQGADAGFAFDGDADRCIGATRSGRILDGDFALYYAGSALHRARRLPGATVVATVMSNLGLQKALEGHGVRMLRAPVGDRYVLAAMQEGGYTVGGEQSGHVIFLDHAPTGDGTLTALTLLKLWRDGAGDLDTALDEIPHFPQRLKNLRVRTKPKIADCPPLAEAIRGAEQTLGGDGRVVVRYSGTEPLARVMIEGPDQALVDRLVDDIIEVFRREAGAGG
jgi:phosphoglucosamine mutase